MKLSSFRLASFGLRVHRLFWLEMLDEVRKGNEGCSLFVSTPCTFKNEFDCTHEREKMIRNIAKAGSHEL